VDWEARLGWIVSRQEKGAIYLRAPKFAERTLFYTLERSIKVSMNHEEKGAIQLWRMVSPLKLHEVAIKQKTTCSQKDNADFSGRSIPRDEELTMQNSRRHVHHYFFSNFA
jgi:hypothetical protein